MPHPLFRAPKHITFDTGEVAKQSELASLLAVAIAEWSKTEGALGYLFASVLEISYSKATTTLSSIINFTARLDVVRAAAADAPITDDMRERMADLLERLRNRSGERASLAHGIWAVSHDHPGKLLRCNASEAFAAIARGIEKGGEALAIEPLSPHLKSWTKNCFEAAKKRFFDIQVETINFSNEIAVHLGALRERERKDEPHHP